jgi:hypothetical protein
MACETLDRIVAAHGLADCDDRLAELIVDGLFFALGNL